MRLASFRLAPCKAALALALAYAAPALAYSFGPSHPSASQPPQWAQDILQGMQQEIDRGLGRPMARNAGAQERKLDANGIGWYSDVRVVALERRADLICALFGRGPEWVVAGCAPVSAAYRLADSLMTNRSLRVYLDHTRRYPPVHRQETFRITHIQP